MICNFLRDLSAEHMLVKDGVHIDNISVSATDIEFNTRLYINANEALKGIDIETLATENIDEEIYSDEYDDLATVLRKCDKDLADKVLGYWEEKGTNALMNFITIEKDKTYYDKEASCGETLIYVVPCVFNVNKFMNTYNA